MRTDKSKFGELEGRAVDLFTLENDNGMTVKITNYGGTVTSIVIPDAKGGRGGVVCGFDTLDGYFSDAYRENSPYFGCLVGRYAGRIKDGKFTLDGKEYKLATNDGANHLHGGVVGFDKKIWDAEASNDNDACVLRLGLTSPDGDEGYPGKVDVAVEYRLGGDNELQIHYTAQAEEPTPLSMTNHTYFNLNGFADKILDHTAWIDSGRYLVPDETNVPTGQEARVAGAACDFNEPKRIGEAFEDLPNGFEHYYVFDNPTGATCRVARFSNDATGRTMEVRTSEPGMLFYTGMYTSDDLKREDGTQFGKFRAFCCEASRYPNGPNIEGAPRCILRPGEKYEQTTVYRFSW